MKRILTTPFYEKGGHEDCLPDPRPRYTIQQELLASYQVSPNQTLTDIFFDLQMVIRKMEPFIEQELKKSKRKISKK